MKTINILFVLSFLILSFSAYSQIDTLVDKYKKYDNSVSGQDDLHSLVTKQDGKISLQNTLTKSAQTAYDVHNYFLGFYKSEIDTLNQEIVVQKEILSNKKDIQKAKAKAERNAKNAYKRASKNSKQARRKAWNEAKKALNQAKKETKVETKNLAIQKRYWNELKRGASKLKRDSQKFLKNRKNSQKLK